MVQHNKTALVTGAARGIGRATAAALARDGAHVLVHYGRSAREGKSLVSEIQTEGGLANAISTNLGTPDVGAGEPSWRRAGCDGRNRLLAGNPIRKSDGRFPTLP
jgi:NAD(P)-dependent dehydrogenase (short-subunit alcohol dehydrogenase family)